MATTPPDLTTELSAVNTLLAGVGEQPVESLEAIESSLVQTARNALMEASRSIQVRGWSWNREEDYPLQPASDGSLPLPAYTMVVHEARWERKNLVQRGSALYNKTDRTYEFPQGVTVKVDITLYLPWDLIPEYAKLPIMYVAQKRFQMRELTSTAIDRMVADDVEYAKAQLEQIEDSQETENILTRNPDYITPGHVRRRS